MLDLIAAQRGRDGVLSGDARFLLIRFAPVQAAIIDRNGIGCQGDALTARVDSAVDVQLAVSFKGMKMSGLRRNGAKEVKTRSPYLSLTHRFFSPLARCGGWEYRHCFKCGSEAAPLAKKAAPCVVKAAAKKNSGKEWCIPLFPKVRKARGSWGISV